MEISKDLNPQNKKYIEGQLTMISGVLEKEKDTDNMSILNEIKRTVVILNQDHWSDEDIQKQVSLLETLTNRFQNTENKVMVENIKRAYTKASL